MTSTLTEKAIALDVDGMSVDIRTPHGVVRAVDKVTFQARRGETLALLGESGCGKSMTATAVVGLLEPVADVTEGAVRITGDSALYAATRLVNWVSPPYGGTISPRRIDAAGGLIAAVMSVCQPDHGRNRTWPWYRFALRFLATE